MYRLAMRDGYETADFSAIFEFVTGESRRRLETVRREVA
jgi:hypothetical protein